MAVLSLSLGCSGDGASVEDAAPHEPDARAPIVPDAGPVADLPPVDAAPADATPLPEVRWTSCDTSEWSEGYPWPSPNVRCAMIEVPLDHDRPDGETIAIRVARQVADSGGGKAVFFLAGGPGGSSVETSGTMPYYLGDLATGFDLVYIDQRGAGGSGYLDCPSATRPDGYPRSAAEWVTCGEDLASAGVALEHYQTDDAVEDFELIRRALGYGAVHVRGGSYGTRATLEWARRYPGSIRAMVLDGVLPPELDLLGEMVGAFDRGIDQLVAECAADAACQQASPQLAEDLVARRARLAATPRPIFVGGQAAEETEQLYRQILDAALHTVRFRYQIPRAVHQAEQGDASLWDKMLGEMVGATVKPGASEPSPAIRLDLTAMLARRIAPGLRRLGRAPVCPGLYQAIVCGEWLPAVADGVAGLKQKESQQDWGDDGVTSTQAATCTGWDVDPIDPAARQPVTSDIPALLLSGELDLQTYPEWGDQVAKTLSRATHLRVPHTGHSTVSVACVGKIITAFLEADGEIAKVDSGCLAQVPHPAW